MNKNMRVLGLPYVVWMLMLFVPILLQGVFFYG